MKTNPLLLAALLIFTLFTVSQAGMPGLGVKLGLSLANQEFDYTNIDGLDFKYRTGLAAGVSAEFFNDRTVSLVAEVDYIQKGFKEEHVITVGDGPQPVGTISNDNRFDYLSIPLYAKITWRKPVVAPYILLGFRFDYLLSYKTDTNWYDDIYSDFKDYDLGGSFGVGGEYKISSKYKVLLEGRYSPAASYAYKTDLLKINNRAFEILAGVQF